MKNIRLILAIGFSMALGAACLNAEPSNFKSGISLTFSGTENVDWTEEVFWYKPEQDDHKVVYLKSDSLITMSHNERNMHRSFIGDTVYEGAGDVGTIRYRVDRDLAYEYYWSRRANGGETRYPEYTSPFSFSGLTYPDASAVLGTTGGLAGVVDGYGDEWHTLAFADDDDWLIATFPEFNPASHGQAENLASDGKTVLFVVNPRTPLIKFTPSSHNAQFYTTPAKSYGLQHINRQITYLTDNVNIELINIMGGGVSYSINSGETQVYAGVISSNGLAEGENTIEYWYRDDVRKVRTVIKNPDFPSNNEAHGYTLWKNAEELSRIKERLQRGADHGYNHFYELIKDDNFHNAHNVVFGIGKRIDSDKAFPNAFIALMEGYDVARSGEQMSYALYAKNFLLDNVCTLDPLWFGDTTGRPNPCREYTDRGYYDVNAFFSNAFAYDILIKDYKSTQHQDGITPIEDLKIRDSLARFCMETQMEMGNYGWFMKRHNVQGMWGMARAMGSLMIAVIMSTYNTHYYGTSGFDGTVAAYPNTPYPDHPVTWKEAFFTETNQLYGYPNQSHRFDEQPVWLAEGASTGPLISEKVYTRNDGLEMPLYNYVERIGYYSNHLMGHCLYITANVMRIKENHIYQTWEGAFDNANKGILYGIKEITPADSLPRKFPQILIVNERFQNLAEEAQNNLHLDYNHPDNNFTLWRQMTSNGVYGLVLYNDEWRNYASVPDPEPEPEPELGDPVVDPPVAEPEADTDSIVIEKTLLSARNNVIKAGSNSSAIIRCDIKEAGDLSVKLYDSKGNEIITLHDGQISAGRHEFRWTGADSGGSKVGSGIYFVRMKSGSYSATKKIAVIK